MLDRRTKLYRRTRRTLFDASLLLTGLLATTALIAYIRLEPTVPVSPMGIALASESNSVTVDDGEVQASPTPLTVEEIVDGIWMLESSRGTTGNPGSLQYYCESRGMSNEYGYGGMAGVNGKKICFETHEKATTRIVQWVNKHYRLYDHDLGRTMCRYNQGGSNSDCKYYQDYLEVSK